MRAIVAVAGVWAAALTSVALLASYAGLWPPWAGVTVAGVAGLGVWAVWAVVTPRGAHSDRAGLAFTSLEPGPAGSMMLEDDAVAWDAERARRAAADDVALWETDLVELPPWAAPAAAHGSVYGPNSGIGGTDYGPFLAAPLNPAGPGGDGTAHLTPRAPVSPPLVEPPGPAAMLEPDPFLLALAADVLADERVRTADAWAFIAAGQDVVDTIIRRLRADLRAELA